VVLDGAPMFLVDLMRRIDAIRSSKSARLVVALTYGLDMAQSLTDWI
jgi:hypothetical protein